MNRVARYHRNESTGEAEICIAIIGVMKSTPFWKRKQKWRLMEDEIVRLFVNPTNEKIREFLEKEGEDT